MAVGKYNKFIPQLTKRELEVIEAVLAGSLRYKSIASSLNISVNTVKTHLRKIYLTVGINNVEALAVLFHGYSQNKAEITPKSPLKIAKSPQMGDRKQHVFAVIFYNIMLSGGKKMQNLKALRIRTKFAIPLVSIIALVVGFTAVKLFSGNSQTSLEIGMKAETVPEGILVTLSNVPPKTKDIRVVFRDWGGDEPDWDNIEPIASFNYIHNMGEAFSISTIEQVNQTSTIIFPFVQHGKRYIITALLLNNEDKLESSITTDCIADGGIYLNRNINLNLNNARTGIALSSAPLFTSDVQFEPQKMSYSIVALTDNNWSAIASDRTDNLSWNFEPKFREHLKETGVVSGDYPAYVVANLIIIHDNISWYFEIAKTPVFTYSL